MRIGHKPLAIVVIAIFTAGIGGAYLLGYWNTTSTKVPVTIKSGEFAGMPSPSDIRGSYTWNDVAKAFSLDVNVLLEAFGATDPSVKVNALETIYGEAKLPEGVEIGTDSVRLFVALYAGLPHAPEESTVLPVAAISVLRREGKGDSGLVDEAAARAFPQISKTGSAVAAPQPTSSTVPQSVAPAASARVAQTASPPSATTATTTTTVVPGPTPVTVTAGEGASTGTGIPAGAGLPVGTPAEEHVQTEGTITGKTTFKDLKAWGLSEEQIKSATGGKIGPDIAVIRDWTQANGLTFSEIKTALQELLAER